LDKKGGYMKKSFTIILFLFIVLNSITAQDEEFSFSQKGGMIPEGAFQIYLRTNDEFTGFSTFLVGFRYGWFEKFQVGAEVGVGIKVYLAGIVTYTEFYESDNRRFFTGLRTRTGFKYQNTRIKLGNALLDDNRVGFYIATDFTAALRLGDDLRRVIYYTFYPFFDIDVRGYPIEIYLSPVHLGFESVFKRNHNWSFAYEAGLFFPLNDVPETSYFYIHPNAKGLAFPNLGNIGFYYTFD
jgi:hypothetical protein